MRNIKNEQFGRSMIEMLGVLAIIGVLSVGGIAGYSKAMMKYRINKAIEQITLISGNVRTFFSSQGNYDGLSDRTVIKKAKLIPDEMLTLNNSGAITAITNPFGYHVSLTETEKSSNDSNHAFVIQYYFGDNVEACIELLSHDWKTANVSFIGLGLVDVADADFANLPADIDKAVDVCSTIVADDSNYMGFYIDVDIDYYKTQFDSDTWY